MYRRVLVAVDGSDQSLNAATRAGYIASLASADLTLLHVIPNEPVPDHLQHYARTEHLDQKAEDMWESVSHEILHRAWEHIEETVAQPPEVEMVAEGGDPVAVIVDTATAREAGLVVVGTRGLNRLSGFMAGSVSQKLAAGQSEIDLLIVK